MKKKIIIPIAAIIICLAGGIIALWGDLEANALYTDSFPENTTINGVDCSKMTPKEANKALTEEWNSRDFTFLRNGNELGSIKPEGTTYKICKPLKSIRKDNFVKTAMSYYFGKPLDLTMEMPVKEPGKAFIESIENADFLKAKVPVETKNAYLDLTGNKAKIVPEVYGNTIDYSLLTEDICSLIKANQFKMEYKRKAYNVEPEIKENDENLLQRQEQYNKYLNSKITYIMGKDKVKISPAELAKIRGVEVALEGPMTDSEIAALKKAHDENTVIESAVNDYVDFFASTYNTFGKDRSFTSIAGNKIEVSGGDYGYMLDRKAEKVQLLADLKSNTEVKREPIWKYEGFIDYSLTDDIGDTYVEISITKQRLWFYKDGKQLLETPVVTGNPYMGYSTPTGTYCLTYKTRNATLKGNNADGSTYESPVSYWMPFYGNYGMHDAPWRGAFGGRIYRGNGSHGCVNMPVWAARELYNSIPDSNVAVVVYY